MTSQSLEQPALVRSTIVIAGALTSKAVETTARAAADLGFQPLIAVDATVDAEAGAHRRSIEGSLPTIGLCRTVEELTAMAR